MPRIGRQAGPPALQQGDRRIFPEELVDADSEFISLSLRCSRCGCGWQDSFRFVCISPDLAEHDDWDGVVLSHVVTCPDCGAQDEYELAASAYRTLVLQARSPAVERVVVAHNRLFDGTEVRRPSRALAHLRELVERSPTDGHLWRRLGNTHERFGRLEHAIPCWRKAVELDERDLEAVYSLAESLSREPDTSPEAFSYLRAGLRIAPQLQREQPSMSRFFGGLINVLDRFIEGADQPFALMAAWQDGELDGDPMVRVSSVDARDIPRPAALRRFVARPGLMSLDLTFDLPEERPTQLQHELESGLVPGRASLTPASPRRTTSARSGVAGRRVGRNSPCPCGSGLPYKACCRKRKRRRPRKSGR